MLRARYACPVLAAIGLRARYALPGIQPYLLRDPYAMSGTDIHGPDQAYSTWTASKVCPHAMLLGHSATRYYSRALTSRVYGRSCVPATVYCLVVTPRCPVAAYPQLNPETELVFLSPSPRAVSAEWSEEEDEERRGARQHQVPIPYSHTGRATPCPVLSQRSCYAMSGTDVRATQCLVHTSAPFLLSSAPLADTRYFFRPPLPGTRYLDTPC